MVFVSTCKEKNEVRDDSLEEEEEKEETRGMEWEEREEAGLMGVPEKGTRVD